MTTQQKVPWFMTCKLISPDDHTIVGLGDERCQCGAVTRMELFMRHAVETLGQERVDRILT